MTEPLVIVGAGNAGGELVPSLAQAGFRGELCVVGDEPHPPSQRPPLSKKFLAGEIALDRLYLKPAAFYDKAGTRLMLDRRVERIDRRARGGGVAGGGGGGPPTPWRPPRRPAPGAGLPGHTPPPGGSSRDTSAR